MFHEQVRGTKQTEMIYPVLKYSEAKIDINYFQIPTIPLEFSYGININTN